MNSNEQSTASTALVFGAFGTIGTAISAKLQSSGFDVIRSSRSNRKSADAIKIESADDLASFELPKLCAVVWAQGETTNDTIADFDDETFQRLLNANVSFVAKTLRSLLRLDLLSNGARLCAVSSIWEVQSRPEKFSYSVSTAALGGLVRSAAIDLAPRGTTINAVMPGVVESEMSARPESSAAAFVSWNPHHRVIAAREVANVVASLCSPEWSAVSGQSIPVDLGSLTTRLPGESIG